MEGSQEKESRNNSKTRSMRIDKILNNRAADRYLEGSRDEMSEDPENNMRDLAALQNRLPCREFTGANIFKDLKA